MPAPGDQYSSANIKNPFDERSVGAFTAQEIATLQSKLNRQLGPEFVSHRQGAGGAKVAYIEGTKAIALANDVFGFNGWSSSLQQVQIDYVDESPGGRISLGLSIIVRVTLRDGTYHEDMGYGTIENAKGKGAAFEKAKKEAATDGLKRALRNFGNVLGNCLYDKEYLKKISGMKAKPVKFDETKLHRHADFALPQVKAETETIKQEAGLVRGQERTTPSRPGHPLKAETQQSATAVTMLEAEDEFGGNLFDGVDISEHQGDEITIVSNGAPQHRSRPSEMRNGPATHRPGSAVTSVNAPQPAPRVQSVPPSCPPQNMVQQPQPNHASNQGVGRPHPQEPPRGPQTANPQHLNARPDMQRPHGPQPTNDIQAPLRPGPHYTQPQNQPLEVTPPQAQQAVQGRPSVGFVSGRAAELAANGEAPVNLPAFNPNVDSPIPPEKRTPGIDHKRSMGITRESIAAPPRPPQLHPQQQPQPSQGFRPPAPSRANFVNPQQDPNRRIGAPQGRAMSPLANRGAYKPPGIAGVKRPPLVDVDVSVQNAKQEGPEIKKAKVDGGRNENTGAAVTS